MLFSILFFCVLGLWLFSLARLFLLCIRISIGDFRRHLIPDPLIASFFTTSFFHLIFLHTLKKMLSHPALLRIPSVILPLIHTFLPDSPPSLPSHLLGIFLVSLPLFLFSYLSSAGFGGGDIKLTAATGFLLGCRHAILAFVIAVYCSAFYLLIVRILPLLHTISRTPADISFSSSQSDTPALRRKGNCFAFGPFLCLGAAIAYLKLLLS